MCKKINILVIAIFILAFLILLHLDFTDIFKDEFLTKAKQNNWEIFVGTDYSKRAFLLDFDGRYHSIFINNNYMFELSLSPKAKRIVFLEGIESNNENFCNYLIVTNIDGNDRKSIELKDDILTINHPALSPSNKNEIAFLADYKYDSESYSLYLFNIENKSKNIIVKDLVSALGIPVFSWSPNGEKIVFTSTEGKIMSVNKDGSQLQPVCDDEGTVPAWSPDGKFIAYRQGKNYVKKFNDGSSEYGWTGSGRYYVVNIETKDRKEIFANRRFGIFPLNVYTQPVWSPDGRYILLYEAYDFEFKTDFWVVNLDKRKTTYHFKSDIKPNAVSWIKTMKR